MASSEKDRSGAPLTRRQLRELAMRQEAAPGGAAQQGAPGQAEPSTPLSRRAMRQNDLDDQARASAAQQRAAATAPATDPRVQGVPRDPQARRPEGQSRQPTGPVAPPQRTPQRAPAAAQREPAQVRPAQPSPEQGAQPQVRSTAANQNAAPSQQMQQPHIAATQQRQQSAASARPQALPAPQRPAGPSGDQPQGPSTSLPQRVVEQPTRAAQSTARAQALRAASEGRPSQPPVVAPPAVTGAVRRIDETGRLTPAVSITADAVPVVEPDPRAPAQAPTYGTPNRIGVRDAVAKAQETAVPRVYPAGVTPFPAEPNQPSRLGSQVPAGVAPRTPAPHAEARTSAPNGPGAPERQSWSAPAPASGRPSQPASAAAPVSAGPVSFQPATAAAPVSAGPVSFQPAPTRGPQSDGGSVPSWDAVLGGPPEAAPDPAPSSFAAVVPIDAPDELPPAAPASGDSWLGYTPFHYVILVVIGLVLGFVCWQLLSASGDAGSKTAAPVSVVRSVTASTG